MLADVIFSKFKDTKFIKRVVTEVYFGLTSDLFKKLCGD